MNANITDVLYCPDPLEQPELSRQQQERKAANNLLRELARAHKLLPRKTILAALQVAALLSLRANPPCPGRGGAYARFITSTPLSVDESDIHDQIKLQEKIDDIERKRDGAKQQLRMAEAMLLIDSGNATAKSQMNSAKNELDILERQLRLIY